jgi:hypothetical protein
MPFTDLRTLIRVAQPPIPGALSPPAASKIEWLPPQQQSG